MQKIGLIQSKEMHDLHHNSPFDINYCVMTNYLNPILEWLNFWYFLEFILSMVGINTTRDIRMQNYYKDK